MMLKTALTILAVTSTASSLSIQRSHHASRPTTALHLEDPRLRGEDKELEGLVSRRDQLKRASASASQPASLPMQGDDIEDMSDEALQSYLSSIGDDSMDVEAMLSGKMSFKTRKPKKASAAAPPVVSDDGKEGDEFEFVDYEENRVNDENEFHITNRIGITTADWANPAKGFVNGKLKKADRKKGKYNKSDLKVSYILLGFSVTSVRSCLSTWNSNYSNAYHLCLS